MPTQLSVTIGKINYMFPWGPDAGNSSNHSAL